MKQADFSVLRQRVLDVARQSAVSKRIRDVVLDSDQDEEGEDFLRVILKMESLDGVSDADLQALAESIEAAVADVDERFASVRFADAA